MNFFSIEKISTAEAWKIRGIIFGVIIFGLIIVTMYPMNILHIMFPDTFAENSACIMINFFGIPCPFCGMSHAFHELIKLNFSKSISYNPSSVIFLPFLGLLTLSIFVLSLFNRKIQLHLSKTALWVMLGILVIIWILNVLFGNHSILSK